MFAFEFTQTPNAKCGAPAFKRYTDKGFGLPPYLSIA